ncbi:FtsX-like permease family protein [Cohnella caldifontis]|uniref:FtsX-like permease family protein n=1 Tax=Cohnella caldifontis TaxID=3027471 RepID=UPI0023EDFA67|nr:FtsX-like permease family protein [Cohnella sp. YIM B05605]
MNAWQIAWRQLKRRKLRTWLTILSIVIGTASALAVISAVDSAKSAFPLYLKAAFGKADFTLNGTDTYFPQSVQPEVEKLAGLISIAGAKQNTKLHLDKEGVSAIQKRVDLTGYSRMDTPLTNFKVVKGSLTEGGAVITDRTARVWKVEPGDTIAFDTDKGTREIRVSAVVRYTVELMGPGSWMMAKFHPWSVAVPLPVLQDWFDLNGKIQSIQIKSDAGADLDQVGKQLDALAKRLGSVYVQPVVLDYSTQFKEINTFFLLLYLAGFLGIALSAFIIFHSMYVSMKERRKEFAAMKTIGYTPEQLRGFVLIEVALMSIIGTAAGLVIGLGLAQLLKTVIFMVFSVYDQPTLELSKGVAIAVLAGLLVPIAAALYPIRQASRVSVAEVLKEHAATNASRRVWPAAWGVLLIVAAFFIKHLLLIVPLMIGATLIFPYLFDLFVRLMRPMLRRGFSGRLAAGNLSRNQGRTAMTSVILCLGIAMIVLMSSLNSALIQSFERVIHASYGGNLDVHLHHIEDTDLEKMKAIPGVADAETYPLHEAVWMKDGQKRKMLVYGVDPVRADKFPLFTVTGNTPSKLIGQLKPDEIVLDRIAFGAWGGEIGQTIELAALHGTKSFKVAAVVDTMKNNGFGAFLSKENFRETFGLKYEKNILVIKDDVTTPVQLRERIFNQYGERVMDMFGPEDWVSVVGSTYTGSFAVIDFLVVLSIVISGIGIANTLLMNIMERVRELGMMRAVGVTRRQVVRVVRMEALGIGLAATLIGLLLGVVLIYVTSTFVEIHSLTYNFGVPWIILLAIALFGLAVTWLASFMPASRAAKTDLSEALRYE